jgi:S1 RNA binding domain protein
MSTPAPEAIEVGQIVQGTVTGITHFGAFVALPNGKTGLVHISEVADAYVHDIKDYLKENDVVSVKVLSMDDRGKVALSIRQADPNARPAHGSPGGRGPRGGPGAPRGRRPPASFEDKLKQFMKDSEDRLSDLRRNTDSKRGGRGS